MSKNIWNAILPNVGRGKTPVHVDGNKRGLVYFVRSVGDCTVETFRVDEAGGEHSLGSPVAVSGGDEWQGVINFPLPKSRLLIIDTSGSSNEVNVEVDAIP